MTGERHESARRTVTPASYGVKISDVAREAGVSTATVSRVLNRSDGVAEHRREAVLRAVERLNYTPNASARALRQRSLKTIGAIVFDLDNEPNRVFVRAATDCAERSGIDFVVRDARGRGLDAEAHFHRLVTERVDGILLAGPLRIPERRLSELDSQGVPIVPSCTMDRRSLRLERMRSERSAINALVEHLTTQHSKLVLIDGFTRPVEDDDSLVYRVELLSKATAKTSLSFDAGEALSGDTVELASRLRRVVAETDGRVAFLCAAQRALPAVLTSLRAAGVQIPAQASLASFGDSELARLMDPAVTVVCRDMYQEGVRMTEHLIAQIHGRTDTQPQGFELSTFVQRETTIPPGSGNRTGTED